MTFDEFRIIGFDLDQTLYQKSAEIDERIQEYINHHIADRLSVSYDDARNRFRELYQDGKGLSGGKTLVALGFEKEEASGIVQEALERADIDDFLLPNAETIAFMHKCANRFESVDLITGSSRDIAKRKLNRLQIPIELFKNVITGDDASKSTGDAYRMWLAMCPNKTPDQFLYVGDRPSSDYEAPKLLGIRSVLVNITNTSADCPQYASIAEFDAVLFPSSS